MDSTVCLYKAHVEGSDVHSLGIDYGQRLSIEMLYANAQCERLGVPRQVISLRWQKPERTIPLDRSIEEMTSSVSPAFLPGRNVVFLSIAGAHAAGLGADEVHIGLNSVEFSGYPDCTPRFFSAFSEMMDVANPGGPRLVAPLLMMSKPEIAELAENFGLGEHDTWSCYRPQLTSKGVEICGACDACRLHTHAWASIAKK
jgi:7-cyano-7-deazaguanine synthase